MTTGSDEDWAYFLERLVHDLREPLRSIHSFSELLAESSPGRSGPEDERFLSEIIAGAAKMRDLVDGLSGYATALHEGDGSASLQLAFNMALMGLDRKIQTSGATVTGDGLPRVDVKLERLTQLLEHLIGNAILFRSEAPPVVLVSAQEQDSGWYVVKVQDNGMGMNVADCEAVFKPFTRLHGRKYPGAGLGLAVCKKIIEGHGGTIRMESQPGKGSTCYFTLPAASD